MTMKREYPLLITLFAGLALALLALIGTVNYRSGVEDLSRSLSEAGTRLAEKLEIKPIDTAMLREEAERALAQASRLVGGRPVAVDYTVTPRPLGLALLLLEMGFITNPEDERLLTDERARRRLMKSVADGIDRYFREPSSPMMAAANSQAAGQP